MGLLKHFLLPFFAIFHGLTVFAAFFGDRSSMPTKFDWPSNSVETNGELTLYESYLFGILGCFHASFLFGCVIGVVHENAHFRAVFVAMEMIMWAVGGWNATDLGFPSVACYVFAGMAAVGLLVHSKEPGIFTKDKEAAKKGK